MLFLLALRGPRLDGYARFIEVIIWSAANRIAVFIYFVAEYNTSDGDSNTYFVDLDAFSEYLNCFVFDDYSSFSLPFLPLEKMRIAASCNRLSASNKVMIDHLCLFDPAAHTKSYRGI